MAYEDEGDIYADDDESAISPLQMLMLPGFTTVTPEGKAKAAEVFDSLYSQRGSYDQEERAAFDEYETRAREARDVLRRAREVLAAKRTPTTKWLELARGFGMPTRAGSFGESIANYAGERIPGRQREAEWEDSRDQQLFGFDQGMSTIDQQLALQRLKLRQAQRTADDKLMVESMKIMGRPTPKASATPQQKATEKLDAAYIKDYVEFIQTGAANASSDITALKSANRVLKGTKIDPETGQEIPGNKSDMISGPIIGLFPKVLRDIFTPKGSETQENVESVAQKSMRVIMGPQFTQKEGENLLARVYNPRFDEQVNARRVARLLEQLERAYAEKIRAAQYFEENGTLAGFTGRKVWTLSMFDPDVPEGSSPLDTISKEISGLTDSQSYRRPPPPSPPPPDEGQGEIMIEQLLPARAKGGRVKGYAEGGKVKQIKKLLQAAKDISRLNEADTKDEDIRRLDGLFEDGLINEQEYEEGLVKANKKPREMAQGGVVGQEGEQLSDGRIRYQMPDGKIINARPGDSYDFVLEAYTRATGTAPTRPGIPPQQIPQQGPDGFMVPDEVDDSTAVNDEAVRQTMTAEPPSLIDAAVEELPSSLAYTAAGAAGAGLGDRMLSAAGNRLIPGRRETPAQRRILDMLAEQRRAPADVVAGVKRTQGMGVPAMAMDDPALRLTAESAMSESGMPNATETLNRLKARHEGIGERVMDQVNTGLKPDEYFDELDKLRDNLYQNSKPLYQQAYAANPAIKSKVLAQLLDTPDGKKAVKIALRIMRNEGKKIGKQDAMNMVTKPSLEFLDNVKRGMDQLITKEEGHGVNYQATPLGKSMRSLRDALRNELDVATTPQKGQSLYKMAREQYAGDLEILDALQSGRDEFSKLQPKQLEKVVTGMSFAEKDAYRTGVAQALFETLETPTGDFNAARKVIGSPIMRKKLRVLFDSDKQYELFETALQKESELYELDKKSMARGQQGQEMHAEPRQTTLKRVSKHVPRLGWKSPTMWALQFIRNNNEATETKIDEVLKHLKASSPDELADFEKTLGPKYKRRISRKGRAAKTAVAGALAAGAYRVATGADDEDDDDAEQE